MELEVLSFEQEKIMLDDTVIDYREGEYILYKLFIAKEVYVYSYKDEHIFEEVELYWYCLEGHCSNIDETEYEQLKE